jgi:hypothetical protein
VWQHDRQRRGAIGRQAVALEWDGIFVAGQNHFMRQHLAKRGDDVTLSDLPGLIAKRIGPQ